MRGLHYTMIAIVIASIELILFLSAQNWRALFWLASLIATVAIVLVACKAEPV